MSFLRNLVILAALAFAAVSSASEFFVGHTFSGEAKGNATSHVVFVAEGELPQLAQFSDATNTMLAAAASAKEFTGKYEQTVEVLAPTGLNAERVVLIGLGDSADLTRAKAEKLGAKLLGMLPKGKSVQVHAHGLDDSHVVAAMAHGMDLKNYRFDRYKSQAKTVENPKLTWLVSNVDDVKRHYQDFQALARGVYTARDITNLPGGDGYPQAIAELARDAVKGLGIKVTILSPEQVREAGMGSLYGVSKGSEHKAYLLALQWQGSQDRPIALVGKGNTFDTGGYNLKTSSGSILRMQTDKAGGGAVIGAVMALAGQKAPVNVVGVVPLSHNLISGSALLPGDVVTAGDGTRIEVANTDAEGRLILADGIWYARDKFNPKAIADIATLTGSKVGALGTAYSAIFTDHEALLATMKQAGENTDELVWQLPLGPYPGIVDSRLADIKNVGSPGAQAGARFLQHFAKDTPWIHIDMAGNAFSESGKGIHPAGANGYGVRLLTEWVKLYAEQ